MGICQALYRFQNCQDNASKVDDLTQLPSLGLGAGMPGTDVETLRETPIPSPSHS